jgi:hypothetical protein
LTGAEDQETAHLPLKLAHILYSLSDYKYISGYFFQNIFKLAQDNCGERKREGERGGGGGRPREREGRRGDDK